jgi:hypothetical protein
MEVNVSAARHYFVQRAVLESIGPVGARNAAFSQVIFQSVENPQAMEITVRTTKEMSIVESVISGRIGDQDITEIKIDDDNWERLAFRVADTLLDSVLPPGSISAKFSGEWSDESPITPAFGNSITNTIIEGDPSTEEAMNVICVNFAGTRPLLESAAEIALEYVSGGSARASQICVREGQNPTWVNVDVGEKDGESYFFAATNDCDMLIGTPPTFVVRSADPAEVRDSIVSFFDTKFAGIRDVVVQVFLRDGQGSVTILEGTTATGKLTEKADSLLSA